MAHSQWQTGAASGLDSDRQRLVQVHPGGPVECNPHPAGARFTVSIPAHVPGAGRRAARSARREGVTAFLVLVIRRVFEARLLLKWFKEHAKTIQSNCEDVRMCVTSKRVLIK